MGKEQIVYLPIKRLKPYKNNPRKNKDAVDAVAASIKEFGFRSPIAVTADGTVINGHTRLKAALKLGWTEVPCVIVDDLTEKQVKEYRLIDNKSAEYALWDKDKLGEELEGLDFAGLDFDFDFTGDIQKNKSWAESKKRCDLKDRVAMRKSNGAYYQSLFKAGTEGKPLNELKTPENVKFFGETAVDLIRETFGALAGDWCVVTTPRRRHASGFHFASSVAQYIAETFQIQFYLEALKCFNKTRINARFEIQAEIEEKNVLLYDDIITTGSTIRAARDALLDAGHTVYTLVSIDNH